MAMNEALLAQLLRGQNPMAMPYGVSSPYTTPEPAPTAAPLDYAAANQEFSTQDADIENQRRQALALSKQNATAPGLIQAGRVSVAGANPLTALSQGLGSWAGMKQEQKADKAATALAGAKAAKQAAAAAIMEDTAKKAESAAAAKALFDSKKQEALQQRWQEDRASRERIAAAAAAAAASTRASADERNRMLDERNKLLDQQRADDRLAKKAAADAKAAKASSYEFPTAKERELFQKGGEKLTATQKRVMDYKDDYSAPAYLRAVNAGRLENVTQGSLGIGTEGQASYWSDVAKSELEPRHEMFGSAFTAPEQVAYDATTITPNLRPEEIRSRNARRLELDTQRAERIAAGALMKGVSPKEVKLYYGDAINIDDLQSRIADGRYEAAQGERRKAAEEYAAAGGSPEQRQAAGGGRTPQALPNSSRGVPPVTPPVGDPELEDILTKYGGKPNG